MVFPQRNVITKRRKAGSKRNWLTKPRFTTIVTPPPPPNNYGGTNNPIFRLRRSTRT